MPPFPRFSLVRGLAVAALVAATVVTPLVPLALAGDEPAPRVTAPQAAPETAPAAGPQLIDGIAAIVGRDVILMSDVDERLRFFEAQLTPAARDTLDRAKIRGQILESMIDDNLLVAEAPHAGVEVTTGEVTDGVEKAVARVRENFPSDEALAAELAREGLDISGLRQSYRDIVRRQMLAQRVIQKEIYAKVQVKDDELHAFFDQHQDEIPEVPARVTLEHVLVTPAPSAEEAAAADRKLAEIHAHLDRGEPFADVARTFSEAPGAERGGAMGAFRRGDLDPAFAAAESVAFTLQVGEVSAPVRTPLGLHLIRLDERTGDRVRASQILVRVATSAADSAEARDLAGQVAREAKAGTPFGELAKKYSTDPTTRDDGGSLGTFALEELTPDYRKRLENAADGEIIGPFEAPAGYQVLRMAGRDGARKATYDEIADQLRQSLVESKAREKYQAWIAELREKIYIRVVRTGSDAG
jgi:peptidyl-prolyl cis-trans isomerase SurA